MTTDLFPEPLVVRASVYQGGEKHTGQVALSGPPDSDWGGIEIAIRKHAIRKAKGLLITAGALCTSCGEAYEADPPPCAWCGEIRLRLWDGEAEYPITADMLRVYAPTTRFNAVATAAGRASMYAAQEFRGAAWIEMPMKERQAVMQGIVRQLLRLYPQVTPETVRTLITDGKREMPYPANWRAVYADPAG
jgi:hypothetical protein